MLPLLVSNLVTLQSFKIAWGYFPAVAQEHVHPFYLSQYGGADAALSASEYHEALACCFVHMFFRNKKSEHEKQSDIGFSEIRNSEISYVSGPFDSSGSPDVSGSSGLPFPDRSLSGLSYFECNESNDCQEYAHDPESCHNL